MVFKKIGLFILVFMSTISHLSAQQTSRATMNITATVTEGINIGIEQMNIYLDIKEISTSYTISPSEFDAAVYSIHSTPGRNISITFQDSVLLKNQASDTLKLSNFELLIGHNKNLHEMRSIHPAECENLQIPESGELHLRIGGTFTGSISTKGLYTGHISIDSHCLEN